MQVNGFKNLIIYLFVFYQKVFCVLSETTGSEEDYEQSCSTLVLIPSRSGLEFMKSQNLDGSYNVTYDCALGSQDSGIVKLLDESHPNKIASLLVKNCRNITVEWGIPSIFYGVSQYFFRPLKEIKELKIRNIEELNFLRATDFFEYRDSLIKIKIDIKRVQFLNTEGFLFNSPLTDNSTVIMKIEEVKIAKINLESRITELYIEKVEKCITGFNPIHLINEKAVLEIKNSNLDLSGSQNLKFKGSQVVMFNNSFQNLEGISIEAGKSFVFEKNYVKYMRGSFQIKSPNVQIVSNNFDVIEIPWFSDILIQNNGKSSVLNVTKNTMNILPPGFLSTNPLSQADVINFKNNSFYCSCKYWNLVNNTELHFENIVQKLVLHESGQNLCVNLDNCPIHTVLNHITEVCMEEFVCDHEKKSDISLETHLTTILSTLNNIAHGLDVLVKENHSSKKNLPMAEQSVVTGINS